MTNRINYKTRRAIVNAIINETKDHGDAIRPLNCERWDDITIDEYEPHCPVITDRKSTRLNSSHPNPSRMPSSA